MRGCDWSATVLNIYSLCGELGSGIYSPNEKFGRIWWGVSFNFRTLQATCPDSPQLVVWVGWGDTEGLGWLACCTWASGVDYLGWVCLAAMTMRGPYGCGGLFGGECAVYEGMPRRGCSRRLLGEMPLLGVVLGSYLWLDLAILMSALLVSRGSWMPLDIWGQDCLFIGPGICRASFEANNACY